MTFTVLGGSLTVGRTWFDGIKFGLFTYNLSTAAGGVGDFDFFNTRTTARTHNAGAGAQASRRHRYFPVDGLALIPRDLRL